MADGGRYKGAREPGVDLFDDIMGDNRTPDIFRTPEGGMDEYESVRVTQDPTGKGINISMNCRPPGCGARRMIGVTWPELFLIANAPRTGLLPQGWEKSRVTNNPQPILECNCGQLVQPQVPSDWAQRQVSSALQQGVVDMATIENDPMVRQVIAQAQMQQQPPQVQGPPGYYPPRR